MLNWDELNEVENTEKTKQVPQEVVKEASKQTAQEIEEPVLNEAKSSDLFKQVIKKFPDANLVDVKPKHNLED